MSERQKEAISLLNRLKDGMTEEEYFLLMDFVMAPQQIYVPMPTPVPQPLEPF